MMLVLKILISIWVLEIILSLAIIYKEDNGLWFVKNRIKEILRIKDRLYKCEYCGVYSYQKVVIKALPPFEKHELHFCSGECKGLWIDMQLPVCARKYKHE